MKTKGSEKSMGDILDDLKHMDAEPSMDAEVSEDYEDVNDNAVVLLVRKIIEDANNQMASDIHIEPYGHEKEAVVRYRIDGRCQNSLTVPSAYIRAVVSRIKILAKMDIAEKRKPQDGKIRFRTSNNKIIELRVVTLPTTNNNEDVVLRLLASAEPIPLDKMMRKETFERFKTIIEKPYGIIMVVGRPVRARPRPCTQHLPISISRSARYGLQKIRLKSPSMACASSRLIPSQAQHLHRQCVPFCVQIRM